jgi:hypothetical protein
MVHRCTIAAVVIFMVVAPCWRRIATAAVLMATPTAGPAERFDNCCESETSCCVGDCNGDGVVTITELILSVNIELNGDRNDACPALDCNAGPLLINCLIVAVSDALHGCPAVARNGPTPAPRTRP